jgi:hypothetical protein
MLSSGDDVLLQPWLALFCYLAMAFGELSDCSLFLYRSLYVGRMPLPVQYQQGHTVREVFDWELTFGGQFYCRVSRSRKSDIECHIFHGRS